MIDQFSGSRQTRTGRKPPRRSWRVPGYGWRVEFSGLERPGQWLAVAVCTAVVLIVAAMITFLVFG